MNMFVEKGASLPGTDGEIRRKLLFRIAAVGKYDPSIPRYLSDEDRNNLVFGDSRILIKPYVPSDP